MNSAQTLPPFPKDSWYVPVIQVHGSQWRPVLWSSCWEGGRGPSQGRAPSPCEAAAHRSRVASAKKSVLWMTGVVKLTNQATTWVYGQEQGYLKKTLNLRAEWRRRESWTTTPRSASHSPTYHLNRDAAHTTVGRRLRLVSWPTFTRHLTPKQKNKTSFLCSSSHIKNLATMLSPIYYLLFWGTVSDAAFFSKMNHYHKFIVLSFGITWVSGVHFKWKKKKKILPCLQRHCGMWAK